MPEADTQSQAHPLLNVAVPTRGGQARSEALTFLNSLAVLPPSMHTFVRPKATPPNEDATVFDFQLLPIMPWGERSILHFNIVAQMDGLGFALRGVRIEWDVCSLSSELSFCLSWGLPPAFLTPSSFDGLYFADPPHMPGIVAWVAANHGRGWFIVPASGNGCPPFIGNAYGRRKVDSVLCPWYDFLMKHASLVLQLPHDAFVGQPKPGPMLAVLASFQFAGKFRVGKHAAVKTLVLQSLPLLTQRRILGAVPIFAPRALNPDKSVRVSLVDNAPCCTPPEVLDIPRDQWPHAPSSWNEGIFSEWCNPYPDTTIREVASAAVQGKLDPCFAGDLQKTTVSSNSSKIAGHEQEVIKHFDKEIAKGRIWGPLDRPPCKAFRRCRLSMTPKNKRDPLSTEFRLISDHSQHGTSSLNDLCWTPIVLAPVFRASHIRDLIGLHGPGCCGDLCDLPSCFRGQGCIRSLLHLFVYELEMGDSTSKFYVDLCNAFGWRPSEYSWACILAVIIWHTRSALGFAPHAFVDNFFLLGDRTLVQQQGILFRAECAKVGLTFHELQLGTSFTGLGWLWQTAEAPPFQLRMVCPDDKHVHFSNLLKVWVKQVEFSLKDLQTMVGLMIFLSAAFVEGIADVQALSALRNGALLASKKGSYTRKVKANQCVLDAIKFWAEFFPAWNRWAPIIAGFSPMASFELFGAVDASTDWGWGGILYSPLMSTLHGSVSPKWSGMELKVTSLACETRESTGGLECLAILRWLQKFGPQCVGRRVLLSCDNTSAVLGVGKSFSGTPSLSAILFDIRRVVASFHIHLRVRFVLGVRNTVADPLSHNRIAQASCAARVMFDLPLIMV